MVDRLGFWDSTMIDILTILLFQYPLVDRLGFWDGVTSLPHTCHPVSVSSGGSIGVLVYLRGDLAGNFAVSVSSGGSIGVLVAPTGRGFR